MRLWYFSSSVNSFFKHACATIQWCYMSYFWSDPSFTNLMSWLNWLSHISLSDGWTPVCKRWKLWNKTFQTYFGKLFDSIIQRNLLLQSPYETTGFLSKSLPEFQMVKSPRFWKKKKKKLVSGKMPNQWPHGPQCSPECTAMKAIFCQNTVNVACKKN